MKYLTEKGAALRGAGFVYDYRHMAYVHRPTRKVVSLDFVEGSGSVALQKIMDAPGDTWWTFYFNSWPTDAARAEMIKEFEAQTG